MELLGTCYILFSIILLIKCIINFFNKKIDSIFVIDITMLFFYGFANIFQCFPNILQNDAIATPSWGGFLMVVLFYVSFMIGHKIVLQLGHSNSSYLYYIPNEQKKVRQLANGIIIFSLILFVIYCSFYGGVRTVMVNIYNIRGNRLQMQNDRFGFISNLYNCAPLAPVLLIAYWGKRNNNEKEIISKFNIVFVFVAALILRISTGSRGAILTYLGIFLIPIFINHDIKKHKKIFLRILLIIGLFFFAAVVYRPVLGFIQNYSLYGKDVALRYLNSVLFSTASNSRRYSVTSAQNVLFSLYTSFRHYAISLELALSKVNSGEHQMNFFLEILIMIQSAIPSKLFGITKWKSVMRYNSEYLAIPYQGSSVPPGIIASAYYSGGIVWVVLYGIITGMIGRGIDKFHKRIKNSIRFADYYYIFILLRYQGFLTTGDFDIRFKQTLTIFIVVILIHLCVKKKRVETL